MTVKMRIMKVELMLLPEPNPNPTNHPRVEPFP